VPLKGDFNATTCLGHYRTQLTFEKCPLENLAICPEKKFAKKKVCSFIERKRFQKKKTDKLKKIVLQK